MDTREIISWIFIIIAALCVPATMISQLAEDIHPTKVYLRKKPVFCTQAKLFIATTCISVAIGLAVYYL